MEAQQKCLFSAADHTHKIGIIQGFLILSISVLIALNIAALLIIQRNYNPRQGIFN